MIGCVVLGILIGYNYSKRNGLTENELKLNTILNLISQEYVDDSVNINDLTESVIPLFLTGLDPHSSYLSPQENTSEQEELKGNTTSIGVSVQVMNDTIKIIEVIPGGPSDKTGIKAGDKIVSIDDSLWTGPQVNVYKVNDRLRGPRGSKVKLGIVRAGAEKQLSFVVTRGNAPKNTVDCYYMVDKTTGYVKVSQFGKTTYTEFVKALNYLQNNGAKRFIIDLRGNGGGLFETAKDMANEFLTRDNIIVSTKGRHRRDEVTYRSDGNGNFQDQELVVLIDEYSASASEIFAGAIQDNDRGLIIGRRSFGKGLVQSQHVFSDNSALILTTAKYYTPSGRCIQRPYNNDRDAYQKEILDRKDNGELYNKNNIKRDKSQVYQTTTGRKVYGGGGIEPDIFVPCDTASESIYYKAVVNYGLIQEYSLKYATEHRASLSKMSDYKQLLRNLPANDEILNDFVKYAAYKGVPDRWYYIHQSQDLITSNIKGYIARDILGQGAYYPIVNRTDKTIEAALKALNKHKAAFPITNY